MIKPLIAQRSPQENPRAKEIQQLEDVLILQLQELIEIEQDVAQQMPVLLSQLQNHELQVTLQSHSHAMPVRVEQLRVLREQRRAKPDLEGVPPISALLNRTRQQLLSATANRGVMDTLLLNAALKIEHIKIVTYEEARDYAELLNDEYTSDTLRALLQEEETITFVLKELAAEVVNESSLAA